MFRKLSMIFLKFHWLLDTVRGEMMRFKKQCPDNKNILDDWDRDEEGFEKLIQCNNKPKEIKRIE